MESGLSDNDRLNCTFKPKKPRKVPDFKKLQKEFRDELAERRAQYELEQEELKELTEE